MAGVYMLQANHAAALESLAAGIDPAAGSLASALRRQGSTAFVAARTAQREAGAAHTFAVEDHGQVVGLADLQLGTDRAGLDVWIAVPFRRRGHGTLAVAMLLELAFQNFDLQRVTAAAHDAGSRRLLAKVGFVLSAATDASGQDHALDRQRWRSHLDAPVIAKLVPGLHAILRAELAAGNEIVESRSGWPDADSVFIRLRRPFVATHDAASGIRFAELNDPHWWRAEFVSEAPRQFLVH